MKNNRWKYILKYYRNSFGFPYYITDYIAIKEIIKLCCCGYSNKRISNRLKFQLDYVIGVLQKFLYFTGWYSDLSFSPLAIYKQGDTLDSFTIKVYNIDTFIKDTIIESSFNICEEYNKIQKELEEYGY
jgi:hypothetical protein